MDPSSITLHVQYGKTPRSKFNRNFNQNNNLNNRPTSNQTQKYSHLASTKIPIKTEATSNTDAEEGNSTKSTLRSIDLIALDRLQHLVPLPQMPTWLNQELHQQSTAK